MCFWIKHNLVRPNHECERGCAVSVERIYVFFEKHLENVHYAYVYAYEFLKLMKLKKSSLILIHFLIEGPVFTAKDKHSK